MTRGLQHFALECWAVVVGLTLGNGSFASVYAV